MAEQRKRPFGQGNGNIDKEIAARHQYTIEDQKSIVQRAENTTTMKRRKEEGRDVEKRPRNQRRELNNPNKTRTERTANNTPINLLHSSTARSRSTTDGSGSCGGE